MSKTTTVTRGDTEVDDDAAVETAPETTGGPESDGPDTSTDADTKAGPDDEAGTDDTAAGHAQPPGRFRKLAASGRFRRFGAAAVAVIAVAALACAVWFGWQLKSERATDDAASAAQDVARDYAVTLTSVSADSIDQDYAAVLDGATGEFKSMYSKSSAQLRQLLVDNKANAEGKVIASGVESASPNKVVVMLFVDQSVRNASTPEPRIDRSRVEMTMELVDGRWLASKVDLP
ncbi:hypothetical protein AAFP35_13700 [Gordonia sp. CPCC 206044]|uniref:hypothetical protein n=1 Tax=Gordonia sp. CPCC 206044 TaxID=3140793 RepID=UPI003AF37AC0